MFLGNIKRFCCAVTAAAACFAGSVYAAPEGNRIASIMYHDITENPLLHTNYIISPELLDGDIKQFLDNGYTFVKAGDLTPEYIASHENNKFVCLTFDDGYTSFYTKIYPILQKYNVPASFYVITSRMNRYNHLTSKQIREMSDSGLVEIGSHTHYIHLNDVEFIKRMYSDSERIGDAASDFLTSIRLLEGITGKKMTSVSYPNGIYNYEIDSKIRNELGIPVTVSTDFGVMNETMLTSPLKRMNRDMYYTSAEFFNRVESMF